jgi:iron complex outermembrane receptor protein
MLQAQNSVSGKVTDKDMNPIVGVSVYAPELHKGTTTDVDGIIRSQIFLLVL